MSTECLYVLLTRVVPETEDEGDNRTYLSAFDVSANTSSQSDDIEEITEYQIALLLWKFCPPVLILLGLFGNMATIVVLCKIRWNGSTVHHHLIGLALADLCLLLTGLLRRWLIFVFEIDVRDLHWLGCKLHVFLTYSAGTMSAWLLVFVTAQRTVAVMHPHHINVLCSVRRSKVGLVVVAVTSCALNVHFLHGLELNGVCVFSDFYDYYVNFVHPWIDMSISSLLPSLILALCNVLLVWKLNVSVKNARELCFNSEATNIAARKKVASSLTITLMVISTTFLVLTLPVCIYLVWFSFVLESREESDVSVVAKSYLVSAVTNILWYTNSAINFLLYCLSGKKFRKEFLRCFCDARRDNSSLKTTLMYSVTH